METIETDQLMRLLADVETPLSVAQLYRLSDLSEQELARFQHAWPQVPIERRRQIVGFLIEIAESNFEVDFEPIFCVCIGDADEEVRARSMEGLWESEEPSLIEPLLEMAQNDPAVRARAAAASALGRFVLLGELDRLSSQRQATIEDTLLTLIRSTEESLEVRRRAVEALAYSGRRQVRSVIENAYYHEARVMRVAAVFAMGRSLDPYWEPLLLDELRSDDPELRYEAACACGKLELASAIPRLAKLLTDEDREVQEACIRALGQIGGQKARQILEARCEAVDQDDEALREAIEKALSELALVSGAVQFPLYEYDMDTEDETGSWAEDWLSGVLDNGPDEMDFEDLDDD